MRAVVILFPGLNADAEMVRTIRDVCGTPTTVVWHTETSLPAGTDFVAIPGGFSYGDYLRCGALAKASPILAAVKAFADRGGLVLGVCNGFQILCEVGMLPGALTPNAHLRFECGDWYVKTTAETPFTKELGAVWRLPIAHGEGRYQATEQVLARLEGEGQIALRYCTKDGVVGARANPNGSLHDIAGIVGGPKRNVFGLMPHPERMSEALLVGEAGGDDGKRLFSAVLAAS